MRDTLLSRLLDNAARDPAKICAVFAGLHGTSSYTFEALVTQAQKLAGQIRKSGTRRGDIIFIVHESGPLLWASFWAALFADCVPAIMPPPSPKQRDDVYWAAQNALLTRSQPARLLVSGALEGSLRERLPLFSSRLMVTGPIVAAAESADAAAATHPDVDDIALLQHSSGTTALKKGVRLSHRVVLRQLDKYAAVLGFASEDVIVSWLPLYHDMGLIACFLMPLIVGATSIVLDPFEWLARPGRLLQCIQQYRGTFCWLPNFAFNHLVNSPFPENLDLSSMRAFINCSEPCNKVVHERFQAKFVGAGLSRSSVQVCYAMAENVFAVTQTPSRGEPRWLRLSRSHLEAGAAVAAEPDEEAAEILSCGRALAGTSLRIVDDRRQPLPDAALGEIAIASDCLFSDYYQLPEKTAEVLDDGWYYSRDLGFMYEGELYVLGRKDDTIIAYGRNFLAHELEAIAGGETGVKPGRVVVFGIPSSVTGTGEINVIFETEHMSSAETTAANIRRRLSAEIGVMPHSVQAVPVGSLIKTTSGKISRELNAKLFAGERLKETLPQLPVVGH